jgi:hypothetical protein
MLEGHPSEEGRPAPLHPHPLPQEWKHPHYKEHLFYLSRAFCRGLGMLGGQRSPSEVMADFKICQALRNHLILEQH